jgi:hypothetical protein
MGVTPGEGVTLAGRFGAVGPVGDEFPPQATYPRASRSKNTIAESFFIFNLLSVIPFSARGALAALKSEQAGCHGRALGFI